MKNCSEEIVQETFLMAYAKIQILYIHDNAVGWLYITVKNLVKAYFRKNVEILHNLPLVEYDIAENDRNIEDLILFSSITDEQADMLKKYYSDGMTVKDLAQEYGISISACKMRLKRIREFFKNNY
jgi:RNA polymerase sigma factor (sigma-70 family)